MPDNEKQITGEPVMASFKTESQMGAVYHTTYMERRVKIYPLQESELRMVGMFNTLTSVFLSVGSGLLTFGLGLTVQAIFTDKLSGTAEALTYVVAPLCFVLALVFFGLAEWARRSRETEMGNIRREVGETSQSATQSIPDTVAPPPPPAS